MTGAGVVQSASAIGFETLYAGYRWNVNSRFSVESAATYYWYPEAKTRLGQTQDTYELSAGASYDTWFSQSRFTSRL